LRQADVAGDLQEIAERDGSAQRAGCDVAIEPDRLGGESCECRIRAARNKRDAHREACVEQRAVQVDGFVLELSPARMRRISAPGTALRRLPTAIARTAPLLIRSRSVSVQTVSAFAAVAIE